MDGIIRKICFDNEELGIYNFDKIKESWKGTLGSVGVSEGRCKIIEDTELDKKILKVSYVKGEVGPSRGAVAWKMRLGKSYDEVYFQFKVKFHKDFNFVKGGKLPGVGGGSLPAGGQVSGKEGFTVRIMWRGEEGGKKARIVQYVYYMGKNSDNKWGEDMLWQKNEEKAYFSPGKWQTLKTRIKMNDSGKKNGIIQSWLDNQLVLDRTNIEFREDIKLGTDTVIFTTFFGGSTNEWAPEKDESVCFDEFILAKFIN